MSASGRLGIERLHRFEIQLSKELRVESTLWLRSTPPTILPPSLTSLQFMNWLARQLVRQIVRMQLPHRREGWLASVSSRFSGTDLHRGAAFLCPNIPSGVSSMFLHEPAFSDPEPDDQAEDY